MRRARTWGWGRTRRYDGPSNDLGPSSPYQSCPDCIIATRGYDFRKGQVYLYRGSSESRPAGTRHGHSSWGNGQSHGGVADDGIASGIIVCRPHCRQAKLVRHPAELYLLEFGAQVRGQRSVALIEIVHCRPDRVTRHEPFQSTLEHLDLLDLSSGLRPRKGTSPRAVDVAHNRQGSTLGVTQEPSWQAGHESMRSDRAPLAKTVGKVVQVRRAGAVAGEVKGDEAEHSR